MTTYIETCDLFKEFALVLNLLPEQGKVALLKNVGDVNNFLHGFVAHLGRKQQILAQNKVTEGKIGERLQENQMSDA